MYQKGDLKIKQGPGEKGYTDYPEPVFDTRTPDHGVVPLGTFFLPHSCQEWVIGGPEEMRLLMEDLKAALGEKEEPRG